jgi:hypothetical protein
MNKDILHHYRHYRQHQIDTYGNSGLWVDGVDQRQFTGGGAAYGLHAYAAYWAARRHISFVQDLGNIVRSHKKRSAAAKRGWKNRRAT